MIFGSGCNVNFSYFHETRKNLSQRKKLGTENKIKRNRKYYKIETMKTVFIKAKRKEKILPFSVPES